MIRLKDSFKFSNIMISIERDGNLLFTMLSFLMALLIYVNLSFIHSIAIGMIATLAYLLINSIFLGHAFFELETPFLKVMLGILLLITLLGTTAWVIMIIYNLDIARTAITLAVVTFISSLSNASQRKRRELRTK